MREFFLFSCKAFKIGWGLLKGQTQLMGVLVNFWSYFPDQPPLWSAADVAPLNCRRWRKALSHSVHLRPNYPWGKSLPLIRSPKMSFNFVLEGRKGRLEEIFEEKKKSSSVAYSLAQSFSRRGVSLGLSAGRACEVWNSLVGLSKASFMIDLTNLRLGQRTEPEASFRSSL